MNRSRVIQRDFENEGTQDANAAALGLAQVADRGLIEALTHHLSALREFGGEVYIGAARSRVRGGQLLPSDAEPQKGDSFVTHAFAFGYTEKSRIKTNAAEPDEAFAETQVPEPVAEGDELDGAELDTRDSEGT